MAPLVSLSTGPAVAVDADEGDAGIAPEEAAPLADAPAGDGPADGEEEGLVEPFDPSELVEQADSRVGLRTTPPPRMAIWPRNRRRFSGIRGVDCGASED
jgi:hypothetical protein